MSAYVDDVLINDERVMYRARISKWSLWPFVLLGALLLPVYGMGLLFWLWAWIVYATTELAITNKRVIAKTGLIQRRTSRDNPGSFLHSLPTTENMGASDMLTAEDAEEKQITDTGIRCITNHRSVSRCKLRFRTAALLRAQTPENLAKIRAEVERETSQYSRADGRVELPMPAFGHVFAESMRRLHQRRSKHTRPTAPSANRQADPESESASPPATPPTGRRPFTTPQ
jgi:hypothetical protein